MGTTIKLDSTTRKSATTAVVKDSVLTCSKTSAADVYVTGIISNKEEHTLYVGESMVAPKMTTLIVRLFRTSPGNAPFSAELDLSPVPDAPKEPKPAARVAARSARKRAR